MKHADIIKKMTTEEKAALLGGKTVWETRALPRCGVPSFTLSDGPSGVRRQAGEGDHLGLNASLPATCFPSAATMANSWDEKLAQQVGEALGEEASELGVDILLGPGLNMKRSPLCGRNFEYFSEDPYLAGKMAAAYVRGIQSTGVYACPKHFAVNSQELRRMAMNSVVDERTLREIYLTGFEIAVKEGQAKTIMTSYNEVNGVYANENRHLLADILRGEWGFDGLVVTDWGASNDHAAGVAAGSDLEMPAAGLGSARELLDALKDGRLTMEELDACVDRVVDAALYHEGRRKRAEEKCRLSEKQSAEATVQSEKTADTSDKSLAPGSGKSASAARRISSEAAHHELARQAARESAVLLKNEGGILPLTPGRKVAVIGDFAFTPRYQGAGSSVVNPTRVDKGVDIIQNHGIDWLGFSRGYTRNGKSDAELEKEALALAAGADTVIYWFGLDEFSESEGVDRTHLRIPENQTALLKKLHEENPNIVGVLSAGSVVEMPWEGYCRGLLHCYLNGQAGAEAVLDVLTGRFNPCGKLNETYPMRYEDTPAYHYFPSRERNAEYREGLYVGYRYYDTAGVPVRYPFGFGLSYTSFAYADLAVNADGVVFTVTNTGKMAGAEIAQLYVSLPGAKVFRPAKELKGFAKVYLKPGESKKVRISFDDKTFRYWNTVTERWETEGGKYRILIGGSSADIRLQASLQRAGTGAPLPYPENPSGAYRTGKIQEVPDAEFAALLGCPIPNGSWGEELGLNDALCQMGQAKSLIGRLVYRVLTDMIQKSEKKGKQDLNLLFIYNIPFRGIAKMTGGAVSMEMAQGMADAVNGHFFRGLGEITGGYFRNARENRDYEKKLR